MPGSSLKRAKLEAERRAAIADRERAFDAPRHPPPVPTPPIQRPPGATGTPYQIVRAVVVIDGQRVDVEIGIPGKVLDGVAADVRDGTPTWRIGIMKNLAVRAMVERREPLPEKRRTNWQSG
jgi:hypothetical protein